MNKSMEKISSNKGEALKSLYQSFLTGINNFKATAPRKFLQSKGLDYQKLNLGFNSGQFHHNKDDGFKAPLIELGMLTKSDAAVREKGMKAYKSIGDYGVMFPLKDREGNIVNFYGYRFKRKLPVGEYMDDNGIYPSYPSPKTTRLFLSDNIIDGATIIESDILENRDAIIALKDGKLTDDITAAIKGLTEVEQIIFLTVNEDSPTSNHLKEIVSTKINEVKIPSESLNEFWQLYGTDAIIQLVDDIEDETDDSAKFQLVSDREFYYSGDEVNYQLNGVVSNNPTLLEMDFRIEPNHGGTVLNATLNLLDEHQAKEKLYYWTENNHLNYAQIIIEIDEIKTELEILRRRQNKTSKPKGFSTKLDKQAKQMLQSKDLFTQLNDLLGKTGIVGNEKSRLLLYLIASSYKFKYNLNAVIHCDDIIDGSGLVSKIANCIPEIEQYLIDITTSRSFRYYGNSAINNKLIVIPDYSGVTESKAINDLKRLQAKGTIINDAPVKNKHGFLNTVKQEVLGHCSSIGACINSKKHFENEPRTVLIGTENSQEQLQKLIEYDCLNMTGQVDYSMEEQTKELLQYIIKNTHALEVVNPLAMALMLPVNVRNARILTMQLNMFTSIITLFNQHQREKDKQGRVIATIEDNQTAVNLFLDTIMLNIDDLDVGTRNFFDKLKLLVLNSPEKHETKLSSFEIQKGLGVSKSHTNRFLKSLLDDEYIKKEGHRNAGYTYTVTNWDELTPIKEMIEKKLVNQTDPNQHGSPETL